MRILIIKPTAFGDVAQALRVVPALKHAGWADRIDWVVDEDYRPLVEACPAVDGIIPFPRRRWRRGWHLSEWLTWARSLRRTVYDVVLDLQGLARSAAMTWTARAGRRVGLMSAREGACLAYQERVSDDAYHAVDRYSQAVAYLLGKSPEPWIRPLPKPAPLAVHGLASGAYTVLHPYSLWETKLWPWESYGHLAHALPQERFVVIGQGAAFPVLAPNVLDLRGRTPLGDLLPLLAHARAVIGTDSGPAHVAGLFDTPLVTLFGSTDPAKTSPRSSRAEVLFHSGLHCRPCLARHCVHDQPMACLRGIQVGQVVRAWEQVTQGLA
jgi:ADP-heptose:LPS heptosyltransferase